MPDPRNVVNPTETPRVGVTVPDVSEMDSKEVFALIDETRGSMMQGSWDEAYLFADLYRRDDWKFGLNRHPTNADFTRYVEVILPEREYTENFLMTAIDVYNEIARHNDPALVSLVLRFSGLTKVKLALPWIQNQKHYDKVADILQVALETSRVELVKTLRAKFPLNLGKRSLAPPPKEKDRWGSLSAETVLSFIAQRSPGLVGGKLHIDRRNALTLPQEYALLALDISATKDVSPDQNEDDFAFEYRQAWVDSLPEDTRRNLIAKAYARFQGFLELVDDPDGDILEEWPFQKPDEL